MQFAFYKNGTNMFIPVIEYADNAEEAIFTTHEIQIHEQVNRKIAAGNSLDDVMDTLYEMTRNIGSWDRIGLAFVEEGGQRISSRYVRAEYEDVVIRSGYSEDSRGSSLEPILRDGKIRLIHDLAMYAEAHPESRSTKLLLREGVRSNLTCGLRVDDRPIALLFFSSREERAFDEHDVAMHNAIAERLAQAVEKAYRIEQLQKANSAYIELLGFVSHELKSPLSSLISSGRLLTDGYVGELQPEQQDRANRMVVQAEYLMSMVKEYLDLARIEDGSLKPNMREVLILPDLIEPSMAIVREQAEEKSIDLIQEIASSPDSIQCDSDLIRIVFVNLLSNGVKYGYEGGRVTLRFQQEGGHATFRVHNTGPGFSKSEQFKLFKKFSRLNKPELRKQKGTGVGLYSCWKIVQMHRGRIQANSKEGEWAEFTVTLPVASSADE